MIQTYWSCLTVEVKGIGITFKKKLKVNNCNVLKWRTNNIRSFLFQPHPNPGWMLGIEDCADPEEFLQNLSLLSTFWEYFTSLDFLQNLSLLLTLWEYFTSLDFLRIFFFSQHPEDLSHQHYEDPSLNINMWISLFNFLRIFLFSQLLSKCFGFFI